MRFLPATRLAVRWRDGTPECGTFRGRLARIGISAGRLARLRPSRAASGGTGAAYCWGWNAFGELGDGTTSNSSVPVAVDTSGALAGETLTQVTTSADHTCAADAAGAAYCWGDNQFGQLGDGDGIDSQSNVPVLAGPQAPAAVTAVPGDTTATVSWTASASLDGSTLTSYTATAVPGGAACATASATTCTITGLTDGTTYSITVVAHTTVGDSGASAPAAVTPNGRPAFTSASAETVAAGTAFSFTVTTTGHPVPKITETRQLPSRVRFADHGDGTATISGTPSTAASATSLLTFTAMNSAGTATQAFTLTIAKAPAIKKIPATTAKVGIPLNLAITATGYPVPALTESGTLPSGLSFTDNRNGTAALAGIPAAGSGGRYPITGTASHAFSLKVTQTPAITSADTAAAVTGSTFTFQVTATGFLPTGVKFTSTTATFSGTPRAGTSVSRLKF